MSDLVFFDESHFVSDDLWRKMGWSQKGSAPCAYQQGIWKKQSISLLLAIGWEGVLAFKIVVGGVDASIFGDYMYEADFKSERNQIFVLDNAPIHRSHFMETNIKNYLENNRIILFQSKYCPDLNPIEMVFGFLKRRVKQDEPGLKNLSQVVSDEVKRISAVDCRNTIMKIFEGRPE